MELFTLGIVCFAMTFAFVALTFVLIGRAFSGGQDWNEADDWFDQDEHDVAFLENDYED